MVRLFISYGIGLLSIIFLCFGCGSDKVPFDKPSNRAGEEESLLLPYNPHWSRCFPLYYELEKEQLWYFMEQPGMLEAENGTAPRPLDLRIEPHD